jgi:type VI secretion system protein ImpM
VNVGFYGKLPSHGDFLRRRVPDAFVERWDAWLQQAMTESRATLAGRWLDVYLTSPVWRFVFAAGACGPVPVIGVMAPSVDRVGRHFPLTIVADLPPDVDCAAAATQSSAFFDSAERLIVETLAAEEVDFDGFDARVIELSADLAALNIPKEIVLDSGAGAILDKGQNCWQVPIGVSGNLGPLFGQLLSFRLLSVYEPLVIWWTEGSSVVEPSCLFVSGLPPPSTFGALLDGSWGQHGWSSAIARIDRRSSVAEDVWVEPAASLRFRSAANSDVGRVRKINEDAFVERPEVGLWAVADGLGGHRNGEVASREVCDALADMAPLRSFEETIEDAQNRIRGVNDHLFRSAGRAVTDRSASTVVALLVNGGSCAILWAGDSRLYRWRAGRLEQLTSDHSVEEADRATGRQMTNTITRAVGVEPAVRLDLERDDVRAGDRFLLCSDGLTRIIPEAQIDEWMRHTSIRLAVDGLIKATLDAGAPDNVTVVIVEAYA